MSKDIVSVLLFIMSHIPMLGAFFIFCAVFNPHNKWNDTKWRIVGIAAVMIYISLMLIRAIGQACNWMHFLHIYKWIFLIGGCIAYCALPFMEKNWKQSIYRYGSGLHERLGAILFRPYAIVFLAAVWMFYVLSSLPSFYVDDNGYNVISGTRTVEMESYSRPDFYGSVIIPDTVNYDGTLYHVTSIGVEAFYREPSGRGTRTRGGYRMSSVILPKGITAIKDKAFCYCWKLKRIKIPNTMIEIGNMAFYKCYKLENVTIPASCIKIGDKVLADCVSLRNATIASTEASMGAGVFSGCRSLQSITFKGKVIMERPFDFLDESSDLETIKIPLQYKEYYLDELSKFVKKKHDKNYETAYSHYQQYFVYVP